MESSDSERRKRNYSPITKSLYMNLNNPIGMHVNLNSPNVSSEKKRLHRNISFSSFANTTCSDISKLNNLLSIDDHILLLTLSNYSFKCGLINKIDCTLQSLRLPQMEMIEPWKEIGYVYPPYKNYDIVEECLYHCFSNHYRINLKNKDVFIPFSSRNCIKDFVTIGDIFFESFQTQSIAFKEPSFVSSLIILKELKNEKENLLYYKEEKEKAGIENEDEVKTEIIEKKTPTNETLLSSLDKNSLESKSLASPNITKHKERITHPQKEEFTNECIKNLKNLNFFNFTAIMVHIGSTTTTCTPIVNGIPLPDLMFIYYIGGYDIDNQIYDEMKRNETSQKVINLQAAKIAKEKKVFTPKSKEECGYLSLLYQKYPKSYFVSSLEFQTNQIYNSAVCSTEIFFSQYALDNYVKTDSYKMLHTFDSNFNFSFLSHTLPYVIYQTILKCPIDYRRELFNNIYLTGGTSIIRGFRERLENELYDLVKNMNFYNNTQIAVHVLKRKQLQKYAIYAGSHYFLELFNYSSYSVTKKEYEECGENVLAKYSLQGKLLY